MTPFLHFVGIAMAVFFLLLVAGTFLAIYKPVLERVIVLWVQVTMTAITLVVYIALCIWLIVY